MDGLPEPASAVVAACIPDVNVAPFRALWHEAPFAVRNLRAHDLIELD